jgi:hypothetical protein
MLGIGETVITTDFDSVIVSSILTSSATKIYWYVPILGESAGLLIPVRSVRIQPCQPLKILTCLSELNSV